MLNLEELTSQTGPRLCSTLPLRLCAFLVKATPGCCRRRNILYHFFFRVVLAGCMKALYFWMLRSQLPRTRFSCCCSSFPTEPAGFSRQKLPRQCSRLAPGRVSFPQPGAVRGRQAQGVGLRGLCALGTGLGVSVLLVRGIPRHTEMDWSCPLASRGACEAAAGHSGPAAQLGACWGAG